MQQVSLQTTAFPSYQKNCREKWYRLVDRLNTSVSCNLRKLPWVEKGSFQKGMRGIEDCCVCRDELKVIYHNNILERWWVID
jgi:hypothetical protein